MQAPRHIKRALTASASIAVLFAGVLAPSSSADLHTQIQAGQSAAASLKNQIAAETSQIEKTRGGVAAAQHRLADIQAQLAQSGHKLAQVQTQVMEARQHLLKLERTLQAASNDLSKNLRSAYENGKPNLVDVILSAKGFNDLLSQVGYIKDAQRQDAHDINVTRTARNQVMTQAANLGKLEAKDLALTKQIMSQRNQESAVEAALVKQQLNEQSARSHTKAHLASVQARTAHLQKKLDAIEAAAAAAARQSAVQVNRQVGGLAIDTSGMVQAPAGAPPQIAEMMAAGNAIAGLPYIWGGGHGSFISPGYDCSGSVSYVLAAAGLLSSPETSGQFESYGDPGPGKWVTIYAAPGHVWMTIAGWRFDTVALAEDGTRWSRGGGEYGGFVVRHPPGL